MRISRKKFIKQATGFCGCAGALLLGSDHALAADKTKGAEKAKAAACQEQESKLKFTSAWIKDLTVAMDANLDEATRKKIMENCGRACARRFLDQLLKKYKGNLKGWLAKIKELWADSVEHDPVQGRVRIVGKKMDKCPCPLANYSTGMPSRTYCYCSIGHMKESFEIVTGKAVEVTLEETVLTKGERCSFRIQIV